VARAGPWSPKVGELNGQMVKLVKLQGEFVWLIAWQLDPVVDARTAVDILARHAPEAAAWWEREAPHCLAPGRKFLFHAGVCEEV
jgi:hypothetical protein